MAGSRSDGSKGVELRFEPSEIERFGLRMARLTIEARQAPATVTEILDLCAAAGVEMLTLRISTEEPVFAQALEEHRFRLMDSLVYYRADLNSSVLARPENMAIREATEQDADAVGSVAGVCFTDYFSHYHADSRLDRGKIAEGYVDWAHRSCTDPLVATSVLLPIVQENIAGFATLRLNNPLEGEGILFAVHPDYAGSGIYGALVDRGKRWCLERGCTQMIVSTQLNNLRVQRSWSNRGFRIDHSYYTFHRWLT